MSTLTSSPSPAASPRASFHIQRPAYPAYTLTSSSPKQRPFNAPPTYHSAATSASTARPPREQPKTSTSQYVDEGTQYSPDGFPPTTGRGKEKPRDAPDSDKKKRKERGNSQSPEPMSQSATSSSASSAIPSTSTFPAEPQPRRDPTPATSHPASASAQPSHSPPPPSEPQEARSTQATTSKRPKPSPGAAKIMPAHYPTCNPKELGTLIAAMIMELIRLNDQIPLRDGRLTRFHSRAPPGISVADYLQRLIHHATLSPPILLSMVWYIDRLCQLYPPFTINSLTVHRFLITAATVAAKGLSDAFWTNPTYSKIGGIPNSELATLELEFLQKVQWKIVPKPEVLEEYYRSLVERTEGYEMEGEAEGSSESGGSEVGRKTGGDEVMVDEPT